METGSTTARDQALLRGRLTGRCLVLGLTGSLLFCAQGSWPARAADRLEVSIDGVVLPVPVKDLVRWANAEVGNRSELSSWMQLLDLDSQEGLKRLLRAPVLTRRSFGQQLLRSWAARPLLDALRDLVRFGQGQSMSSEAVLLVLERLLKQQPEVSTLDLLQAIPGEQLRLDLDALVQAADRWRRQIKRHQALLDDLGRRTAEPSSEPGMGTARPVGTKAVVPLSVAHRDDPLEVQTWLPRRRRDDGLWLVLMPGLGGNPEHFHWLAGGLADAGWPVALLEHPGSDAAAVQALLDGRTPFDGSQALKQRLADLEAVLTAQADQRLPVPGQDVVLVGHSLGALTALLAAGAVPDAGTDQRCRRALVELPLTNLSRLLQCELAEGLALGAVASTTAPAAVVGLNSLGSLFWTQDGSRRLSMPLLLVGGTLDLITPPLDEQVALFSALASHPSSRVVVVEGASHFSPIRVGEPSAVGAGDDLFQLGEDLVGVNPFTVQAVIGAELIHFLETLSAESSAPEIDSRHLSNQEVRWHRLNRSLSTELVDRHQ